MIQALLHARMTTPLSLFGIWNGLCFEPTTFPTKNKRFRTLLKIFSWKCYLSSRNNLSLDSTAITNHISFMWRCQISGKCPSLFRWTSCVNTFMMPLMSKTTAISASTCWSNLRPGSHFPVHFEFIFTESPLYQHFHFHYSDSGFSAYEENFKNALKLAKGDGLLHCLEVSKCV